MGVRLKRRFFKVRMLVAEWIAFILFVLLRVLMGPLLLLGLESYVRTALSIKLRERLDLGEFKVDCPNPSVVARSKFSLVKEADTVEWIYGLPDDAVLWDVGANIGIFSLVASARGLEVLSFEPQAENYALLIRNIGLNAFAKTPKAFSLALFEQIGVESLEVSSGEAGAAMNSILPGLNMSDSGGLTQPVITVSGSQLVGLGVTAPTHIKLDVDGNELQVLKGFGDVLDGVVEIWLEMPLNDDEQFHSLKSYLETCGFGTTTSRAEGAYQNFRFVKSSAREVR